MNDRVDDFVVRGRVEVAQGRDVAVEPRVLHHAERRGEVAVDDGGLGEGREGAGGVVVAAVGRGGGGGGGELGAGARQGLPPPGRPAQRAERRRPRTARNL